MEEFLLQDNIFSFLSFFFSNPLYGINVFLLTALEVGLSHTTENQEQLKPWWCAPLLLCFTCSLQEPFKDYTGILPLSPCPASQPRKYWVCDISVQMNNYWCILIILMELSTRKCSPSSVIAQYEPYLLPFMCSELNKCHMQWTATISRRIIGLYLTRMVTVNQLADSWKESAAVIATYILPDS